MSTGCAGPLAEVVTADMQQWLERAVIGLNLCPFAKAVHVHGQVHYAVSTAPTSEELLAALEYELLELASIDAAVRDTTLLMAPLCLAEFIEFNDFLLLADRMLYDLQLDGVIQIASFHPRYQFAGSAEADITNFTNRAPYPTLHLLREASVERAVHAFPQAESIFEKNILTMERLGVAGWSKLEVAPRAAAGRLLPGTIDPIEGSGS